jgi:acetaldehyde dehydrogenase
MAARTQIAIIGSGNIGTDLLIKVLRVSKELAAAALVGIDARSDGLQRAARLGVVTTADGIEGLVRLPNFDDIEIVFDATSAAAHERHDAILRRHGKRIIDLTPAALGRYTVPSVNGDGNLDSPNVNMVTCGGQATIPIVAAVNAIAKVHYAEIVASIASRSAGPGTRTNIDEFTETTSRALETVGGASRGKAIIVLNPAEPPMIMRDTVYCLTGLADTGAIADSVASMVKRVQHYVPGYRLKQEVQFDSLSGRALDACPDLKEIGSALKVTVLLEVEGAAHYLPAYAGNLDIMTSAALQIGEKMAARLKATV